MDQGSWGQQRKDDSKRREPALTFRRTAGGRDLRSSSLAAGIMVEVLSGLEWSRRDLQDLQDLGGLDHTVGCVDGPR
jgi:hypothetical protein